MICLKCGSSEVQQIDVHTAKCHKCGYALKIKVDGDPTDEILSEIDKDKAKDYRFDPRKYNLDPSWMSYFEKKKKVNIFTRIVLRIKRILMDD